MTGAASVRAYKKLLQLCKNVFWSNNRTNTTTTLSMALYPGSAHGYQKNTQSLAMFTFCVSRRRRKMYCGHARLCVCLCVCLSAAVCPHYYTDPGVTWGHGRGCPLVVHHSADLQSGHGLRCYGNITRTLVTSLCPSSDMTT